jgi:DNA primase
MKVFDSRRALRGSSRVDSHAVKAAIPPAEFYPYEIATMPKPKGGGWVNGGLCPFHDDRHSGSFRVNVDTGAFRCFSCDARGGSIIDFAMQRYALGFRQALESLAREWGVPHE